ncbi:MAG: hypothetical protein IKU39_00995 [Lachnospiraceae bacterium]|nr:hypothetical protein [Lachnospiraceae bacterium]
MKKMRWKSTFAFVLICILVICAVPSVQVNATDMQDAALDGEDIDPEVALASDTNAPVVEEFSFDEQGQTLKPGDKFHITIKAYDTEGSDISAGYMYLSLTEKGKETNIYAKSTEKLSDRQYRITYEVSSGWEYEGNVDIISFEVYDVAGNTVRVKTDDSGNGRPSFNLKETVSETIKIKEIKLSKNTIELTDEVQKDSIEIEFIFEEGKAPSNTGNDFELWYRHDREDGNSGNISYVVQYQHSSDKWIGTNTHSHGLNTAGTYTLEKIYFDGATIEFSGDISYTVTITSTDTEAPVVMSVELYYDDQKLEAGTELEKNGTLQVRAKVEDASGLQDVYVKMDQFLSDVSADIWDMMTYDEALEYYIYDVDLTQLYATEWAVSYISASDIYGNQTTSSNESYDYEDLYFYVKDESGTIVLPDVTYEVHIELEYTVDTYPVTTGRKTSLKEIFPDGIPCEIEKEDITFLGWSVDVDGVEKLLQETDTFLVKPDSRVYVKPVYDKMIVNVYYVYYDTEAQLQYFSDERVICENGLTYEDLMAELGIDKIVHGSEFGFIGWTESSGSDLTEVIRGGRMTLYPQYKENILRLEYRYCDKDNKDVYLSKAVTYESDDTYRDVMAKYLVSDGEHTSEYFFTGWTTYFEGNSLDELVGEEEYIGQKYLYCYAQYSTENPEKPENPGNAGNSGGSGSSEKTESSGKTESSDETDTSTEVPVVTEPEEPLIQMPPSRQETSVPELPLLSAEEEKIVVKLADEVIAQRVEEVQNAEEGTTFVIGMETETGETATEVPVAVLEAVKGKDVKVVLDMGGYSWTINGKDILATNLSAINLEVNLDTEAVAPSIVETLAGGEPTRQISLTHNGNFGFKACLTINLGSEHEGEYGNLYYHDSNGKLVFMNAGQIDADGNVSLDFSHASDYVVVVGRDRTEEENKNIELLIPEENADEEVVPEEVVPEEVKNADQGMFSVVTGLVIVAAAACVLLLKKKHL